MIRITFFVLFFLSGIFTSAQVKKYTVANAHSHNDYLSEKPFYLAFQNGYGSIEAYVFAVNGNLYVAHTKTEIQDKNTLKSLYIDPLLQEFSLNKIRKLILLVDIKESYANILPLLIKELIPLRQYLHTVEKPNYLVIVITGNRPPPALYKDYPNFLFFDDDLKLPHTVEEWKRVGLVSLPFNKISAWKGSDDLSRKDRKALAHVIDSTHRAGKKIRFWAAPDTIKSWKWQKRLHVDLIGTDKVRELANFFKK